MSDPAQASRSESAPRLLASQGPSNRSILLATISYLLLLAVASLSYFAYVRFQAPPPTDLIAALRTNLLTYSLHAGLVFSLLLVFRAVFRITGTSYVRHWSRAYLGFLSLYLYLSAATYLALHPHLHILPPPPWLDSILVEFFSFASTLPIFLAGLDINNVTFSRQRLIVLLSLLSASVFLPHLITLAASPGSTLERVALIPGGVLACLVLTLFGSGLRRQLLILQPIPSPAFPTKTSYFPAIIAATFYLYGLLQIFIPYLQSFDLGIPLNVATYILKALCGGAVVLTVLTTTWRTKELEVSRAQAAERSINRLLNVTRHGLFITTSDGTLIEYNDVEASILGLPPPPPVCRSANRFALVSDEKERDRLRRFLTGDDSGEREYCENTIRQPDGTLVHLRTYGNLEYIPDARSSTIFTGLDRNVTREKLLQAQRDAELNLQQAYINALNSSENLEDHSLAIYLSRILSSIATRTRSERAYLFLYGREDAENRPVLILKASVGVADPLTLKKLWLLDEADPELYSRIEGYSPLDPGSVASELLQSNISNACRLPMTSLTGRRIGLILLEVDPITLSASGAEIPTLLHLVARASTANELVWRQELQRQKDEISSCLVTSTADIDSRLHALIQTLKESLHLASASISLATQSGGESKHYLSGAEQASIDLAPPSRGDSFEARQTIRQISTGSRRTRQYELYAELELPVCNHRQQPLGLLELRGPHDHLGRPTAYSLLEIERLSELTSAIGGIVETWRSFTDELLLFEMAVHEMHSPAVAIRNRCRNIQVYSEQYTGDKLDRAIELILNDANFIGWQVQKIERAADRHLMRNKTDVMIFDVIQRCYRQLLPQVYSKARLDVAGKHNIPILHVAEDDVYQVVVNLLSNAVKYAVRGRLPSVSVEGERGEDSFVIRFRDKGIGVDSTFSEKIFEPRFRAPNGVRHEVRGMGIGLFVARKIAQHLGGDLKLTNGGKNDRPTEFAWSLPFSLAKED